MEKSDLEQAFDRRFDIVNDNFRALCPFHDESTPSFLVHQSDLVGHCFGCDVGGPIDWLLTRYSGCTEEEAKRRLGISAVEYIDRAKSRKKQREPIKYYSKSWLAPWKREVHQYVIERGFRVRTIQDALGRYDSVLQRQVFPVFDREKRLVGATGRSCGGAEPKWYHYWKWEKGRHLYHPFPIDKSRPILIVEGIFDLLWLYQNGVDNVVATLGAGATRAQHNLLVELGSSFILGFDNDGAGRDGSQRFHRGASSTLRLKFIDWPLGTHDWMDLNRKQIEYVIDRATSHIGQTIRAVHRKTENPSDIKG